MTVPDPTSLLDVKTEWGGPTNPSLTDYYRGGSYVPDNYNTTGGVSAAGAISLRQLTGTLAEADGATCLAGWWPQRSYYNRAGAYGGSSSAPDNNVANVQYGRYTGSVTSNYGFSGSTANSTGYSKTATSITWAIGAQNSISSVTESPGSWSAAYSYAYREQSVQIRWGNQIHRNVTSGSVTYSRLGNNSGTWDGQYIIPGKWQVDAWAQQPVTDAGYPGSTTLNYALEAGKILLLTAYRASYDSNLFDNYHTITTGIGVTRSSNWWYNAGVHQMFWNGTGSSQNIAWSNAWTAPGVDGKGNAVGAAANGMFQLSNSANGHQVFILSRIY
jgi:hypothetical protein